MERSLPLTYKTPPEWAKTALSDPLTLLNDHAHLEKKAASNALDLLPNWPEPERPAKWVRVLCSIARDEVEHLGIVVKLLERRGGEMSKGHRSSYAQALRALVRRGDGPRELVDRLLISGLIEARSCERFLLLSKDCEDRELQKLYTALWASEHGHFKVFLGLAGDVMSKREVDQRWSFMLDAESEIIQAQRPGSGIHSGI